MAGGGNPALRDAIAVNAGAALQVCGLAKDIRTGTETALQALSSGAVARKVEEIIAIAATLERADVTAGEGSMS